MAEQNSGLMESIKRLVSTFIDIVSTRLELIANEIQEERLRLGQVALFALMSVFFFGMGILFLSVFITVLFWEDHRLAVTGGLCMLFILLGVLMAVVSQKKASGPGLFSVSIAELAKDKDQLESGNE